MKIVFAATQSKSGSTLIGRILPIAVNLPKQPDIHILALSPAPSSNQPNITIHPIGREPFLRTQKGKQRLRGFPLFLSLLKTAFSTALSLYRLNPDVVIIVKPHPPNTLGVYLWRLFHPAAKIILDADDFELTANVLTSIYQRGIIHASERLSVSISNHIVTASPFLSDHFKQLSNNSQLVTMIPTGIQPQDDTLKTLSALKSTSGRLLYIGSVSRSSGHQIDLLPDILKSLRQNHHVTLTIAGDGDDVSRLKQRFHDLRLTPHVTWTGRFSSTDIPALLNQADIIIDPIDASLVTRAKSSYRVLLAAINGRPVITSNIGIRPYLLPQSLHHKFFADPNNADSYVDKIKDLIDSPLSDNQRQALKKHARQFTWKKLAHQYNQIITTA